MIKDFKHDTSFWFTFQFKADNLGATLFSGDVQVKNYQKEMDYTGSNYFPYYQQDSTIIPLELYLSRGGYYTLMFGEGRISSWDNEDETYTAGDWAQVMVLIRGRPMANYNSIDDGDTSYITMWHMTPTGMSEI